MQYTCTCSIAHTHYPVATFHYDIELRNIDLRFQSCYACMLVCCVDYTSVINKYDPFPKNWTSVLSKHLFPKHLWGAGRLRESVNHMYIR